MTYMISRISIAEAATIINATTTFAQITISLSLVILLVHFMPRTNTAHSWSSIGNTLHTSFWPTMLRTDSSSTGTSGAVVAGVSYLTTFTTVLVAIAGVVLPLGLSQGPIALSNYHEVNGKYVPDTSALALTTRPDRENFVYGRKCSTVQGFQTVPCPDVDNGTQSTAIPPSTVDIFNSTPHGPFTMQYRQFFEGSSGPGNSIASTGFLGMGQTLLQRNDTFASEGLIVDMSPEHPGIGFWNQTLPDIPGGGSWAQDVLWLEPVTQCVDSNLTLDYFMLDGPDVAINNFNLTDHGGFVDLTRQDPSLDHRGQDVDLTQHAYRGGVYSNLLAMLALNITRQSSSLDMPYALNRTSGQSLSEGVGKLSSIPLSYLNQTAMDAATALCRGFGKWDTANITNVHIDCALFLTPPQRTDGGDARIFDRGSKWIQKIHSCASATRASIQKTHFSTNDTHDLQNLRVTRQLNNLPVLWATEKTDLLTPQINLFWGRVDDRYESDPSLWTIRSEGFYLPAGALSFLATSLAGFPSSAHIYAWSLVYGSTDDAQDFMSKAGQSRYAIQAKLQSLLQGDSNAGHAQIRNLMWTDIMANNLIGTQSDTTLWAAGSLRTITYDFRYAIPGFILLMIWAPSFLTALFLLLSRSLTLEYVRKVLNHVSVGRVVLRESALRIQGPVAGWAGTVGHQGGASGTSLSNSLTGQGHRRAKSDWANAGGSVMVVLELDGKGRYEGVKSGQS